MAGVAGSGTVEHFLALGNHVLGHGEGGLHRLCRSDLVGGNAGLQDVELSGVGAHRGETDGGHTENCHFPCFHKTDPP